LPPTDGASTTDRWLPTLLQEVMGCCIIPFSFLTVTCAAGEGSLLTKEALAGYRVRNASLAETFFLGDRVVSVGDEFGGSLLVQTLNTVEAYNFPLLYSKERWSQALHYLVEALKFAYVVCLSLRCVCFSHSLSQIRESADAGRSCV
jgi:hypothetical protein